MRVLNASHLADTGGNGWRTAQAFAKLAPDWHYRSTARNRNWLDYPADLPWEDARAEWQRADVVHLRDGFQAERLLGVSGRPTVIHQHGTQFRLHQKEMLREQRRRKAVGLGATLDLVLMAPDDLTWAPALYDLAWLASLRDRVNDGVLRIAHAPTNRGIKSTDAFLTAAKRLGRELPVEVILIERTPWAECVRRKARADVYFDQVTLGYGNNAIEAWGMGLPVIAGAADTTLREMERRFGVLPFVLADEGSILAALRVLADARSRMTWARTGWQHVERFHSEAAGVALLQSAYRAAVYGTAVAA